MEKARKQLKFMSEVILILLAFSFIRSLLEIILVKVNLDDVTALHVTVAKIILGVFSVVVYLPQAYIGFKGLKVAKKPDASKAHIVWAVIFVVFSVFAAISAVAEIINTGANTGNIFALIDAAIDFALYFFYLKFAKQVMVAA